MATRKYDKSDFQTRIKSISNPRNTSYYDPNLGATIPKRVKRKQAPKTNIEDSLISSMIVSMVLGGFGLMVGQVIRVRLFGITDPGMAAFTVDVIAGIWAVLIITVLTKKRLLSERFGQFVGIALMLLAGHNLIWRFPDQMGILYTPEYVEQVLETLPQHSIVLRGQAYTL